jgi:hypothetical protein
MVLLVALRVVANGMAVWRSWRCRAALALLVAFRTVAKGWLVSLPRPWRCW